MTNFPSQIDTDTELPPVYNNIVDVGEAAINAIRAAMFAVEENLGVNAQGSMASVGARLDVSLNSDGTLKSSAVSGLGLVVLPITNGQVSATAAIDESKLHLTYSTQSLYNLFGNLSTAVNTLNNFNATTGIKVEPHIAGSGFRHKLSHIDVDAGALNRVNITTGTALSRNLTNSYTLVSELANDVLAHTRADGLSNTTTPPANMAHTAGGIYINPTNFVSVPQTANDLQSFVDFVDGSSLILLGSRTQNLFGGGIPKATRNTSLVNDKAGEAVVDPTSAQTFLLYGSATSPVDAVDHGDDVILLSPSTAVLTSNVFDAQFSQVKPGDYITVNYGNGSVPVQFTIDSTKKFLNGTTRVYSVRINGKNLFAASNATVRIDRPFYHDSKFNALALAAAHNSFGELPSLIVSNPNGAAALGMGFDPKKLDRAHYNLYLEFYPTGNPAAKLISLPPIDVTGDTGISVGSYTLDGIVQTINNQLRQPGYNSRFIAFAYQGQLGIALADRYGDASFSIISGVADTNGDYQSTTNAAFPGNVVDNYNLIDPLGFGVSQANVASPPFAINYSSPLNGLKSPTVIFAPVRKSFYYVDGVERDSFASEVFTAKDGYGDGYWSATITSKQVLANRVEVTYEVDLDLSTSGLKNGKTIVVQPAFDVSSSSYSAVDYGRFTISNIAFSNCDGYASTTTITVYDAISNTGVSPFLSSLNIPVFLYFSDDSVSFNAEQVSDPTTNTSFKRLFEVYVDSNGKSFTHERARLNANGSNLTVDTVNSFTLYSTAEMSVINLVDVSPKLRGYNYGQYRKLNLFFNNYNATTGIFDGYMCKFDSPSTFSRLGATVSGKKGEVVRFYDDTNVDYIDISIPINQAVSTFANKSIDIQLYPTLQLNQEKVLVGTCQLQDSSKQISYIKDKRQFGNISEKQLSTSALNYISTPQRLLEENGLLRGFDLVSSTTLTNTNQISIKGGVALVDGKFLEFNDTILSIPVIEENVNATNLQTVRWYVCVNSSGEFEFVASTDYAVADAGTYGALTHDRLFYALNPATTGGVAYPIRATYFQKLLSDFKDLTPLYVVSSTVGPSGGNWIVTSATISDARRYIEKGYHGLANTYTLGSKASFRSLTPVLTYMNEMYGYISYNLNPINIYGNTVYVRDMFDISGTTFDFKHRVKFVGDGGKFTVNSGFATLHSNVEFRELDISVANDYGFKITGNNITFDKCEIAYSYDATSDGTFTASQLGNIAKACIYAATSTFTNNSGRNITITNCNFTTSAANHFPVIGIIFDGMSHYLENISIEENHITATPAADDKRASIVITSNFATTPTTQLGPRLVNARISRNKFNKNQMILMSGAYDGSSKIQNMLVAVDVAIEKNVCGAICFLVRQDRPYNVANIDGINDKENMLTITQNVCRYIYCGTNLGFINVVGSTNRVINDIVASADIYSGSFSITNNACSWIQIGVKNPTTYAFATPMLDISGNKINAYNSAFLTDYHSVITPSNIGLIVDNVVGT
jgi:hypothetical protein